MGVAEVHSRLQHACVRVGRDPSLVRIVAVTKGHSVDEIRLHVLDHGLRDLGESRVAEALEKRDLLDKMRSEVRIELIGTLQRNKVKFAQYFSLIHSLDTIRLAEALARWGDIHGALPPVLIEVNTSLEESKHGFTLEEVPLALRSARELGLDVRGLMTIAPKMGSVGSSESEAFEVRRAFQGLRVLRDSLGLEELSMGMSDDFELAIEEGATIIRVGRALFDSPVQESGTLSQRINT